MIKVNKLLATLLISMMVSSVNAAKIEVMPTVGKAFKASQDRMEDTEILYGVRGTVFLNDEIAVQTSLETSNDNAVGTSIQKANGAKTDLERVSANIIYEKNTGKRIRPYAMVGVGNESTHGLVAPAGNDGSQGFVNLGAGLKFGITKKVDLVTEARWIRKLSNDDDDIIATIGLGVNTGSSAKSADQIPSVQATSDVQNAINLAEFRKISEKKKVQTQVVESVVTTVEPMVIEEDIPTNAIILDEDATQEATFIEDYTVEPSATSASDGYYVQMAALFEGTGEGLTDRLESKDYPYVLHNVEKRGREATLVLVGPYESRVEAAVAIKYLKRLKSDAFIYHMN